LKLLNLNDLASPALKLLSVLFITGYPSRFQFFRILLIYFMLGLFNSKDLSMADLALSFPWTDIQLLRAFKLTPMTLIEFFL
jgi:hypothetical protein